MMVKQMINSSDTVARVRVVLFALLQYIRERHIHVVLVVGVLEQACTGKVLVGPRFSINS